MNKLINMLVITDQIIIGSYDDKNIKYKSDIDINEFLGKNKKLSDDEKNKFLDYLYEYFLNLYDNQTKYNYYITEFKCGFINNNKLYWTEKEVRKNRKEIETIKGSKFINLQEALLSKSIIKIDILYIDDDDIFKEITKNYFFEYDNFDTTPLSVKEDLITSLTDDAFEYKNKDYIKFLKRVYKIKRLKKVPYNDELKIINSHIGRLDYFINHILLIDKFNNIKNVKNKKKIINKNLEYVNNGIKEILKIDPKIDLSNMIIKYDYMKKQILSCFKKI